jgi:hypothetical protein
MLRGATTNTSFKVFVLTDPHEEIKSILTDFFAKIFHLGN